MSAFGYALRAFTRARARNAAYALGVALAVALLTDTLFFVQQSAGTMTQRAVATVTIDLQARSIDLQTDPASLLPALQRQPGITAALPMVSLSAGVTGGSSTSSTAVPARLFAMPPEWISTFPVLRVASGQFSANGVLVSEQLATQMGLHLGDSFALTVAGRTAPYPVTLSGTVNTDTAEPLFAGPVGAPEGANTTSPAVVIMDYSRYTRDLAAGVQAAAAAAPATSASTGTVPVDRQVDLRLDRAALPSDPGAAATQVGTLSHALERQASGQLKVSDNISSALTGAQRDVVSARLLFLFLGLPGVLLAAALAQQAAALALEAQRRDLGLLRARGLSPTELVATVAWTAGLTASVGAIVGMLLGSLGAVVIFGFTGWQEIASLVPSALVALLAGLVLGGLGAFLPARQLLAGEIGDVRRTVRATQKPIWLRLPLDLALLAAAALALWLSGGYNTKAGTAGATETAAVSLGIYAFLGPLLFWLGSALLFLRLAYVLLGRPPGHWQGGLGGLVRRSLHRRPERSAAAALLLALAVSFGVASSVFGATYEASRRADARYLIGSDLRVTPPLSAPQPTGLAASLQVPGVQSVTPVQVANNVLVGSQTQTVYGIDVPSLLASTTLQDSFFVGDTAQSVMQQLRTTPTGLLVSNELASSYSIVPGDMVAVRIPNAAGGMTDARLHVLGIFTLFPTSSQNSDLVVNSAFLTQATGNPNAGFFLLKTDGTLATNGRVATALGAQLRAMGARVQTADQAISQDQSSLVGVNLSGLMLLDRLYAALVVALGFGVFLLGAILERSRELGTLEALGATLRQVIGTLLLEAGILAAGGVVGGLLMGGPLAWQYTGFLPGIFSVPMPVPTVPILELAILLLLAVAGIMAAGMLASLRLRRVWPAEVLRDL